jgi:ketosteroid isomerase-like protein
MAEHPDAALVRRGYQAFSTADGKTLSEIIAEDATQYQPGASNMSGEYKGLQAILKFYGRLASETNGSFRVEVDRLYTDGKGQVVATHRATGQRAGRNLDTWASLTFTVVDGTVTDLHGCQEDLAAWDDFWA